MRRVIALGLALFCSACAAVVEGTSQEIVVNTDPQGARCIFERGGISVAVIDPTPGAATIKKSSEDILIKCEREGYRESVLLNKSDLAAATFGNIILGGAVGIAVDAISGANNKYASPVTLALLKEQETPGMRDRSGDPGLAAQPERRPAPAPEDVLWADVRSRDDVEGYEAFLEAYPKSRHVPAARYALSRANAQEREVEELCTLRQLPRQFLWLLFRAHRLRDPLSQL